MGHTHAPEGFLSDLLHELVEQLQRLTLMEDLWENHHLANQDGHRLNDGRLLGE
jgi:hypothetical protein